MNLYSALSAFVQHPAKPLIFKAFGGESSNGRTADSDSASLGSNPSSPANLLPFFCFSLTTVHGRAEC